MNEDNIYINEYKKLSEKILGESVDFEYIGGATDSREFAVKGSVIIMHSGSGNGMHALDEYVDLKTVAQIAEIQIEFLKLLKNMTNK